MGIASTLHDRMSPYRACDISSQRAPSASGINITIGLCHATVFLSLCDRVQMSFAVLSIANELGWTLDEQAQVMSRHCTRLLYPMYRVIDPAYMSS